eukprot:7380412-Prymnesium_polylepis.1
MLVAADRLAGEDLADERSEHREPEFDRDVLARAAWMEVRLANVEDVVDCNAQAVVADHLRVPADWRQHGAHCSLSGHRVWAAHALVCIGLRAGTLFGYF